MSERAVKNIDECSSDSDVIDVGRLILLVQARPALYDVALKEHHNLDVTNKCWDEIGNELNVAAASCKAKWTNLRNSYSRHLRETKKMAGGGSGKKKKKWHLADALSFVDKRAGSGRKVASNLNHPRSSRVNTIVGGNQSDTEETADTDREDIDERIVAATDAAVPIKHSGWPSPGTVAAPIVEYSTAEDPMLTFFKSLLHDCSKLEDRRRRSFKSSVLAQLNALMDEQEDEQFNAYGLRAPSTISAASSVRQSPGSTQHADAHGHGPPANNCLPESANY